MKLTTTQYNEAKALGFTAYWHKLSALAEAVYNDNSFEDVKGCKTADPDKTDMEVWNIAAEEWRNAQSQAIGLAMAEYEDEYGA